MRQVPSLLFVLYVACAVCKARVAHLEFTPPGMEPVSMPRWSALSRAAYAASRSPSLWWFTVESEAYTNGAGENITAEDARRYRDAFRYPRTFARVHTAGLKGDAGFCAECDVPYCTRHWHLRDADGERALCPLGHRR
ncbi:hypothetical protein ACH4D5_19975 [Streptomyces sp. NPDC018029]|uniref:hypothetical protein n=1 Tax=Streptomyces sp. NPDC018029 TaxID=3365032 RepID=UPI0037927E50